MSEDYKQKMRDAAGELLLQLATGEISAEDAQREVEICKALNELIRIAIEMGAPWPPEERMRQEATLIAKWPEACRRAGVGAIPMAITSLLDAQADGILLAALPVEDSRGAHGQ